MNFVVGNSRQRSLISFTHAIGRIPKEEISINNEISMNNVPRTQQVVIEQNSIQDFGVDIGFLRGLFQEEESLSFLLSLVYEEYKKVPRWIWSLHMVAIFIKCFLVVCISHV